jgi:hypothetical protein
MPVVGGIQFGPTPNGKRYISLNAHRGARPGKSMWNRAIDEPSGRRALIMFCSACPEPRMMFDSGTLSCFRSATWASDKRPPDAEAKNSEPPPASLTSASATVDMLKRGPGVVRLCTSTAAFRKAPGAASPASSATSPASSAAAQHGSIKQIVPAPSYSCSGSLISSATGRSPGKGSSDA